MKHRLATLSLAVLAGPDAAQEPAVAPPTPEPVRSALYWADVDGDGLQDALAVQADGSTSLLLNLGGGDFLDASEAVGLAGLRASSAAWGDADGDGRTDLYLASREGPGKLLLQTEEGVFADVTPASGLPPAPGHVHARWYDFDADEKVDLHLIGDDGERLYRNLGRARFEPVQLGPTPGLAGPAHGGTGTRGTIGAGAPGTTPGSASTGGSAQSGASFVCLDAITDQSSGLCLQASSLPTLGQLYPLGPEFNIDSLGRVGIGTTTPGEELDVAGDIRASGQLVSSATSGSPLVVGSSELVALLNADRLDGLEATAFRLIGDPITVADLAADSVDSSKILDGSITAADLATDSVGADQIATDAVGNDEIANSAVGTLELLNGSIQDIDVSTVGISGAKIHPDFGSQDVTTLGTVQAGGQLVSLAGTGAPLAVASSDLVALLNADRLDGLEAAAFRLVADPILAADLADDSVGAAEIAFGAVGAEEIQTGAVGSDEIATDAVGVAEIASNSVGWDELQPNAVLSSHIANSSVASEDIQNNTIDDVDVNFSAGIAGTKIDARFGGQDVTTLGDLGVGTENPTKDIHVIGSGTLASALIAPNSTGGDDSELILGENVSGSDGMKLLYDGNFNQLQFRAVVGGLVFNPEMTIEWTGVNFIDHVDFASTADFTGHIDFASSADFGGDVDIVGNMDVAGSGTPVIDVTRTTAASSALDLLQIVDNASSHVNAQFIECEVPGDVEFRVNRDGDVSADGTISGGGADFAEMIEVSTGAASVEPGDVLVIDPTATRAVQLSSQPYSRLVAGVYSAQPGLLGSEREWDVPDPDGGDEFLPLNRGDMAALYDEVPMAVVGIVPCKVSGQNGPIQPGDLLVTSSIPGHAMVDNTPPIGTVLGKALEGFDGTTGVIKVLVTLQ